MSSIGAGFACRDGLPEGPPIQDAGQRPVARLQVVAVSRRISALVEAVAVRSQGEDMSRRVQVRAIVGILVIGAVLALPATAAARVTGLIVQEGLFVDAAWTVCGDLPATCVTYRLEAFDGSQRSTVVPTGPSSTFCLRYRPTSPPAHGTYYEYITCGLAELTPAQGGSNVALWAPTVLLSRNSCNLDLAEAVGRPDGCDQSGHGEVIMGEVDVAATITATGPASRVNESSEVLIGGCRIDLVHRMGLETPASAIASITADWLVGGPIVLPVTTTASILEGTVRTRWTC